MQSYSRRRFLTNGMALALAAAMGDTVFVEPGWFDVTTRIVPILPPAAPVIRVAHIADLHAFDTEPFSRIEEALFQTIEQEPDLVVITGDFYSKTLEDFASYKKVLAAASLRVPVYAVAGNHDGGLWAANALGGYKDLSMLSRLLEESEITLLHNRSTRLFIKGVPLTLVGVGDYWSSDIDAKLAFSEVSNTHEDTIVLLNHNPDGKESVEAYPWHLMLSGHTHGGQIVVPFVNWAPCVPVKDRRYIAGLYPLQDRYLNVTRGIGTCHGIRFNCRPEISILDLCSKEAVI